MAIIHHRDVPQHRREIRENSILESHIFIRQSLRAHKFRQFFQRGFRLWQRHDIKLGFIFNAQNPGGVVKSLAHAAHLIRQSIFQRPRPRPNPSAGDSVDLLNRHPPPLRDAFDERFINHI